MMQKYQSHKIVYAGKITRLRAARVGDKSVVNMIEVGGQQFEVPPEFTARGTPDIGDYLVQYPDSDNYISWSPAAVFEDGNTLIDESKPHQDPNLRKEGEPDPTKESSPSSNSATSSGNTAMESRSDKDAGTTVTATPGGADSSASVGTRPCDTEDDDVDKDGSVDAGALESH